MRDLSRYEAPARQSAQPPAAPSSRRKPAPTQFAGGVDPQLEVVAAMGFEPGTTFDIRDGATMGRSDEADIHIDDPFASSAHARIFLRGEFMYVEDMASTNGTYLNGRQLKTAERLKMADVIRIGDTEYRYRE